ncbi:MAG: hypothetical protein J6P93_05165 [Alphaproteobacteria bacterium]|nr:hypothetical protein [Alphaproteobacteria bacterium]
MFKFLLCLFLIASPAMAEIITFPINPPREYDFKKKKEIFSVRKKMLKEYPVFYSGKYEPTSSVFAQIEDGKPWWGLQGIECKGPGEKSIDGPSEESRFIDNPFLLVGIDQAGAYNDGPNAHCSGRYPKPSNLKLNKEKRAFSVEYTLPSKWSEFDLAGRNAVDFGVPYVYADKVSGVEFTSSSNVSTDVYQFKDFIHVGGSCGYPGGCNNGSPHQPEIVFRPKRKTGRIHLKLWRQRPNSKDDPADMTFDIKIK